MNVVQRIALALVIIGAINWGLIGFFNFDLVAGIFGGQQAALSRVIYALVGLSGLYSLTLFFNEMDMVIGEDTDQTGDPSYGVEFSDELDLDNANNTDNTNNEVNNMNRPNNDVNNMNSLDNNNNLNNLNSLDNDNKLNNMNSLGNDNDLYK